MADLTFKPLEPDMEPAWDAFYARQPGAWPGQHRALFAFARATGLTPRPALALTPRGEVAALLPIFETIQRRARLLRFRVWTTGAGLRGGPLVDDALGESDRQQVWQACGDWLRTAACARGIDEVRVALPHHLGPRPVAEVYPEFPLASCGFEPATGHTMVLPLDGDEAALMARLQKRCRNMVRRADREGVVCAPFTARAVWMSDAMDLNRQTYAAEPVDALGEAAMACVWDGFVTPGMAHVYEARDADGRLASVVVTVGSPSVEYIWHAFNRRNPPPPPGAANRLWYEALSDMATRGVTACELGSIETTDPRQRGISTFKQSFGGDLRPSHAATLRLSPVKQRLAQWLESMAAAARRAAKPRA